MPCDPPKLVAEIVSKDLHRNHRHCFTLRGLTLPGMIDEPGSFSGKINSPKPQRGPEASQRTSFAIFINDAASVLNAPLREHQLIMCGECGKLIRGVI